MKLKPFIVPVNTSRLASAVAVRAARAGVITHKVVRPNLAAGALSKFLHPAAKV